MHASFNFLFVLLFFLLLKFFLLRKQFLLSFESRTFEGVDAFSCEPSSDTALNVERGLFPFLSPHCAAEISLRVHNFVISIVDIQTRFLHLTALLTHHVSRFSLILVSLH